MGTNRGAGMVVPTCDTEALAEPTAHTLCLNADVDGPPFVMGFTDAGRPFALMIPVQLSPYGLSCLKL